VLPRQGSCGVQMADGDSQSVGHVGRLGHGFQMQQVRDHGLDLRFFSPAVAHDRRLDGQGSILGDYQMRAGGGQHGDAANMSELERRLDVGSVEDVFNRHLRWLVLGDDFIQLLKNLSQAGGKGLAAGEANSASGKTTQMVMVKLLHDTVTGDFAAAINP